MTAEEVISKVEELCGLPTGVLLKTSNRTPYIVMARSAACYIAVKHTHQGFRQIAKVFHTDHSLPRNGFNRVAIGLSTKDPGVVAFMRRFYEAGLL